MSTHYLRCSYCGARLEDLRAGTTSVPCAYCETVNVLPADAQTAIASAQPVAQEPPADPAVKGPELMAKMQAALMSGDKQGAVRYYEGYLRLQYASAIKQLLGTDPKYAEPALKQIEDSLDSAVKQFAEMQGVKYTPIKDRSTRWR